MLNNLKNCWGDALWRLSFSGVAILGFAMASLSPYHSIIGIERFGLSELEFAVVTIISAIASAFASMAIGVYSDQTCHYKEVMMASLLIGALTNLGLYVFASKWMFMIAFMIFIPIASTAFSQFFGLAKLAANKNSRIEPNFSASCVRAAYAGAYAVTPPIWAMLVLNGADLLMIFGASAVINLVMTVIVFVSWPEEHKQQSEPIKRDGLKLALAELANAPLAVRLFLVTIAGALANFNSLVMGLIVLNDLGGTEVHVGWFAGIVALIEIPVMLYCATALRYLSKAALIMIGVVLSGIYLSAFSFLPSVDYLWWLILPASVGGGLFIPLVIGYIQDLLSERPGTGGALVSLANIGGYFFAALVFGICTQFASYSNTAMIGAALSVLAAIALVLVDGRFFARTEPALQRQEH